MSEEDTIKELSIKFGEKNPQFVRLVMENHWAKGFYEASQGRINKHDFEGKAKQL